MRIGGSGVEGRGMAKVSQKAEDKLIKSQHPARPDWDYRVIEVDEDLLKELGKPPVFAAGCVKACTTTITLLPKFNVGGKSGVGFPFVNVDGYRIINAFVISDPLKSSTQRGFSLEMSFGLDAGGTGETSVFFNFDNYFDPASWKHPTLVCQTSDLLTTGNLPWIGGVCLSHILRVPVMGPYVRASVFNEDSAAHQVQVIGYLST
jgi:hypothetical protein